MAQICGNFAKEGECGTCEHFALVGVCSGVCFKQNYEYRMCEEECDCGKYKKEKEEKK